MKLADQSKYSLEMEKSILRQEITFTISTSDRNWSVALVAAKHIMPDLLKYHPTSLESFIVVLSFLQPLLSQSE